MGATAPTKPTTSADLPATPLLLLRPGLSRGRGHGRGPHRALECAPPALHVGALRRPRAVRRHAPWCAAHRRLPLFLYGSQIAPLLFPGEVGRAPRQAMRTAHILVRNLEFEGNHGAT